MNGYTEHCPFRSPDGQCGKGPNASLKGTRIPRPFMDWLGVCGATEPGTVGKCVTEHDEQVSRVQKVEAYLNGRRLR